jgi:hypothetical protein
LDTNVQTRSLDREGYILTIKHEVDDHSFIAAIIKLSVEDGQDSSASGETIFMSFPQDTPEEAEQSAMDYYKRIKG